MPWELLLAYLIRLLPAFFIVVLFLILLPKEHIEFRIFTYIFLFILIRDTMTPMGLWKLDAGGWLRLMDNAPILIAFGFGSLGIVALTNFLEPDLNKLLVWNKGSKISSIVMGVIGAFVIALPAYILYSFSFLSRGPKVAVAILPFLLFFAVAGNFYEEALFRGYFQGHIEKTMSPLKAALVSGTMFALGHTFLATTVTNVGTLLIVFTFYEGTIAALLRMRYGLISATLAHGGGVFLLASSLL